MNRRGRDGRGRLLGHGGLDLKTAARSPSRPMTKPDASPEKIRLVKFGSKSCPACSHMDRSRVLENFQAAHPDVVVIKLDVADEEGETPKDSEYDRNMKLSDDYGVDSLPTLIFESLGGGELASWEGGVPVRELEKVYKAARTRLEAAQQIPMPK